MSNNLTTGTRLKSSSPPPPLKPSSLPSNTASLNETIGVPGWQIVNNGDLPVITLSDGGQSLIGYNGAIQTLSAVPTISTNTNQIPIQSNHLNHALTIIIILISISLLIFTCLLTSYLFIKKNKKTRKKNFVLNTLELKRKSHLWNQSKFPTDNTP